MIVALPVIVVDPPAFVPLTVYTPAIVWFPKEIAAPVPAMVGVRSVVPLMSV
jgi:hypothetical protein